MASFASWQTQLLRRLGMPVTARNVQFLTAWQAHEGGSAANNPLNTTQGWKGASDYNSVGVKNYGNPNIGLLATAKTLRNGYYPGILSALKSGNPTWNPVLGKNLSTWGTGSSWMGGYRNTPVPPGAPSGPTGLTGPTPRRSNPAQMQFVPAGPRTITRHEFDPLAYSSQLSQSMLGGQMPDWGNMLSGSYKDVTETIPAAPGAGHFKNVGPPPHSNASPPSVGVEAAATPMLPKGWKKLVVAGGGMDRAGVRTNPQVFQTVARIASIYGRPLTIGTGSNHREYVAGSNRRSDHWFGEAADIPMTGAALTKLGQDALIMAGMPVAQARKQTGGVFNVGGYNILFNTHVGGNHFNHLHVGLGRIIGRPA